MDQSSPVGLIKVVIIGTAVVWSAYVIGESVVRFKTSQQLVEVTGSAAMPITSDLIIWTGSVNQESPTLSLAYTGIKSQVKSVVAYLQKQGIDASDISTSAITTTPLYEPLPKSNSSDNSDSSRVSYRKLVAYDLQEQVEVRSTNVMLVDKVSREVTDLLSSGINFSGQAPQYLYTKLGEAKVEILAKAAADARRRADTLSKNAGANLGVVRYIRANPLQITPRDDTNVSSEGQNDTTSLYKTITAIVDIGVSVR